MAASVDKRGPTLRQQWRDAVRDSTAPGIDAHAIAVAMALDRHMSADGQTRTAVTTLAALARVSKNTVTDRIERLEAAGLLRVDRGNGRSSRYRATITDPDRPTLWDATDPVDNPEPSHPMGHSGKPTIPPHGTRPSHPTEKASHPMGPTPIDPVEITPKRERRTPRARTNGHHPPDPHPLLDRDPLTVDVIAEGFAYHLSARGRADPHEITDTIAALITRLAPTMSGPGMALVTLADRLDALPDHHRRTWPRELANDLYPPPPPPGSPAW